MGSEAAAGGTFAQRYRLLELVGEGASARVFLADDLTLRRRVAVKVLNPGLGSDEGFRRRFEQEMKSASALNLPRLLHLHDWGLEPEPYMVNEYVDGGSLAAILDAGNLLAPSQALFVGLEVARGLANLHARGKAHLAINASNILFDSDDRVFIADLGLAAALADPAVEPSAVPGDDASDPAVEPSAVPGDDASDAAVRDDSAIGSSRLEMQQARDLQALASLITEAVTGVSRDADASSDGPLEVPLTLGPMQSVLENAAAPAGDDGDGRLDASGFAEELLRIAGLLPRPERLPLVRDSTGHTGTYAPIDVSFGAFSQFDDLSVPAAPPAASPLLDDVPRRRWPGVLLAAAVVLGGAAAGVWAWLESRPVLRAVPEFVGQSREAAVTAAAGFDWQTEEVLVRESGTRPGEVVRTEPVAGAELADGGSLVLFVSLGEPLQLVADLDDVVFGRTVSEAEASLTEAGFEPSGQVAVSHDLVPEGNVVGIDADPGVYEIARGSKVRLRVSEGPDASS